MDFQYFKITTRTTYGRPCITILNLNIENSKLYKTFIKS